MTTFIVSMPPNSADGRRKTTKLEADDVQREGDWVTFTKDVTEVDSVGEEDEIVAEFYRPESWMMDGVTERIVTH